MAERNTKLILDTEQLTEEFFGDTRLLGIMAPVKDYQFCWHLNNTIGLNFRSNNDLEIQLTKKKRNYFFAVYEYAEPTRFYRIMFIITSLTGNTYYPNSSISIFCG